MRFNVLSYTPFWKYESSSCIFPLHTRMQSRAKGPVNKESVKIGEENVYTSSQGNLLNTYSLLQYRHSSFTSTEGSFRASSALTRGGVAIPSQKAGQRLLQTLYSSLKKTLCLDRTRSQPSRPRNTPFDTVQVSNDRNFEKCRENPMSMKYAISTDALSNHATSSQATNHINLFAFLTPSSTSLLTPHPSTYFIRLFIMYFCFVAAVLSFFFACLIFKGCTPFALTITRQNWDLLAKSRACAFAGLYYLLLYFLLLVSRISAFLPSLFPSITFPGLRLIQLLRLSRFFRFNRRPLLGSSIFLARCSSDVKNEDAFNRAGGTNTGKCSRIRMKSKLDDPYNIFSGR